MKPVHTFLFFFYAQMSFGVGVNFEQIMEKMINEKNYLDALYLTLTSWEEKKVNRQYSKNVKVLKSRNTYINKNELQLERRGVKALLSHYKMTLDYYFNDKEFSCRMPALNMYFNYKTGLNKKCNEKKLPYILSSDREHLRTLRPEKIYSIEYVLADEGEAFMSRWGHSMLRIVVCAPFRIKNNEKCLEDTSYHLFFSFRGDVTDQNINSLKGLIGTYKSRIYIHTFEEIKSEYIEGELRDLKSLELNLSYYEKELVVGKIFQDFWGYEGSYKFLNQNCATEMADILSIVSILRAGKRLESFTPKGLFEELGNTLNNTNFDFQNIQDNDGTYKISSKLNWYKNTITKINNTFDLDLDFEQVTGQWSPQHRKELFEKLVTKHKIQDILLKSHFLILEKRAQFLTLKKMKKLLIEDIVSRDESLNNKMMELLNLGSFSNQLKQIEYGIPTSKELEKFKSIRSHLSSSLFLHMSEEMKNIFHAVNKQHQINIKIFTEQN